MTKTITAPIPRRPQTGPAEHASVEGPADQQREESEKWAELIATTLAKWEESPEILDDGEGDSPSIEVIWRAMNGAGKLRCAGNRNRSRVGKS